MKFPIHTERLRLRYWEERDLPYLIELNQDKDVMEYFLHPLTASESHTFYQRMQQHLLEHQFSLSVVEHIATGEWMGYAGCMQANFEAAFTPCVEIGWKFHKKWWGNGYATEAAKAWLHYAFAELSIPRIYSFTSIHNIRSEAVMKRIGMQKTGEFNHPKVPANHHLNLHVIYAINKVQFEESNNISN